MRFSMQAYNIYYNMFALWKFISMLKYYMISPEKFLQYRLTEKFFKIFQKALDKSPVTDYTVYITYKQLQTD